jgi:plastocyanin
MTPRTLGHRIRSDWRVGGLLTATAVAAAGLLSACKDIGGPADDLGLNPPAGSRTVIVRIVDFAFVGPDGTDAITVAPGDTVEFVNLDVAPHTATSTSAPQGRDFDSGTLLQNQSYRFVPTSEGAWIYRCDFHPAGMSGATITVSASESGTQGTQTGGQGDGGSAGSDGGGTGGQSGGGDSGGSAGSGGTGGSGGSGGGASGTVVIDIRNFKFVTPNGTDSITISLGQTVEFVNSDGASHTATSSSSPSGGAFNSNRLRTGQRYQWKPSQAGTWVYLCDFHPDQMSGAVIRVVDDGGGGSGGSGSGGSGSGGAGGGSGSSNTVPIAITPSGFSGPGGSSDVAISLGQTVEWSNSDSITHTVSSTDEPKNGTRFDSGDIAPGGKFNFKPDEVGVWEYRCDLHGHERGMKITVR